MSPERARKVRTLFEAVLEFDPADWVAFVKRECAGDEELETELLRLLEAHRKLGGLIPELLTQDAPPDATQSGSQINQKVGSYRIIRELGRGGMGVVYLAEQLEPIRRQAALKVIGLGMNTREVIARFESERQALALMDHPAIAKVFDAGSTPQGAPYFVMEYIDGFPINTYCDNHRLNTRERLELFMHVCEGVQHAHQKAIIHRDLKPSNILVTEVDGKPAPKIIDFGVSKALNQQLTADTMFTRAGALVGTPEYMSPEQAGSSGQDIDTRSDVYSLGIILYELLAGSPPIELRKIAFDEFLRRLREDDPPKPSTKIRMQDHALSTELARKRDTEPVALARQISGDLDSIALKALEKDRSQRYGSPSDFAADIARFLNNEPVTAIPPSAAYRVRKFARRYRAALATAGAFALVLVAAAGVSLRQSVRADKEAAVAEAVDSFLQNDVLAQASADNQAGPNAKPDPDLKVRTALDRAAVRIAGKFDKQPEVEAAIRYTMGQTYLDLGQYPEARKQLERALQLQKRVLGPENPKTLKTMKCLGETAFRQGNYPEARALLKQALDASERVLGPEQRDTLACMYVLGNVYDSDVETADAEALHKKALEIQRRVLGPSDPATLDSMILLAYTYSLQGKHDQAAMLTKQTLEIQRRVMGPEHPKTLDSMNYLAMIYSNQGKRAEAEALWNEILGIRRRVLGPEHPDTMTSMNNLAYIYHLEHKNAQAEVLNSQTLEIRRRVLGPNRPETAQSMHNLANTYYAEGKYAQAADLETHAIEILNKVLGSDYRTMRSVRCLAQDYAAQGKYAQAEALYRKFLQTYPTNPDLLDNFAWYLVAVPDHRRRRPEEALRLSRQAVQEVPSKNGYYNTLGLAEYRNDLWDRAIASLHRSIELDAGTDPTDFFFLAMAQWRRGDRSEAEQFFQRGVDAASKDSANQPEWRMFWGEAADLLGKAHPVPTLFEVQAEPARAMEVLKHGAEAGQLTVETLEASPDLKPLTGRSDFQALIRALRSREPR